MSPRYLFGPLVASLPDGNLRAERASGRCLTFGWSEGSDLTVQPGETWETLWSRLPQGWRPDFVVLDLHYSTLPTDLWSAPVPIVGLAADWNLLWHYYRHCLPRCDLVLTDTAGVAAVEREGIAGARVANLFGCGSEFLLYAYPPGPRTTDVLFVGNLHPSVQRARLPWLGRLARLGRRWRVAIRTGVFGDAYRNLLGQARIVFNYSLRGECNLRTFECAAAGALLFQEEGNLEVPSYFRPGEDYVTFTPDNLEAQLTYYLEHENERRRLAESARDRVARYSHDCLWEGQLETIQQAWPALRERAGTRAEREPDEDLHLRVWQALSTSMPVDASLLPDLEARLLAEPTSASLWNALGLVLGRTGEDGGRRLEAFRRAWVADSHHVLAGLNLAEALAQGKQAREAADQARSVLLALDAMPAGEARGLDEGHFPPAFDDFRVEWEWAAWLHAGDRAAAAAAKCDLLRWRLHALRAQQTDSLEDYRAAAGLRPDLSRTQAAFGCALGRAGRFAEAVAPLRAALAANPFDNAAARALFQVLLETDDRNAQRELAAEYRLLAQAAPQSVPVEPWFAPEPNARADRATATPGGAFALRLETLSLEEFRARFGDFDTRRALCGYTPAADTHAVLTLLAALRPHRIVEVGTALGHMTANLTEWSPDDATIFTLGTVADLPAGGRPEQHYEQPGRADFGRLAGHFGKAQKVLFATADSLDYDFDRLAPLDFAFIDGAHDFEHVLSDTRRIYAALRPGGCLAWHDFGSPVAWVEVRQAVEAAGLPDTVYHVAGTQVAFLLKEANLPAAAAPPSPAAAEALTIVWEGEQTAVHSLALVNRAFCEHLLDRGHEVSLRPLDFVEALRVPTAPLPARLAACCRAPLSRPVDVHIRHRWPPDFTPPPEGHWVMIQPWEFGSLPRAWIRPMTDLVDEVWAYTDYVRACYLRSGLPADRVHVVPLGVDPVRFHPAARPAALQTAKRFKFLFVGGTIHRKGIDLLLSAYAASFRRADDVCLVVKDMGAGSFYRGQTAEDQVAAFRAQPDAPEIEYLERTLSDEELPGLYAACHCLAHPYRGEGFGLPIAEAMASGLPVIVTGHGAALDFCGPEHGYLVPAREVRFAERRVGDLETVEHPWLAEPDAEALAHMLRHVYEHPDEARARGHAGSAHIRSLFTWDRAAAAAERRLTELRRRPVRRREILANGLTGTPPPPTPPGPQPRLSLCMIVRNEEANLPACLASVDGVPDDVVVVDTGSADRTKELALRHGARAFDFPWVDSFAAARNEALRHARGKYIMWMDADDRLDAPNRDKLRALVAGLDGSNVAYVFTCLCLPDPESGTATEVDHVRLFRAHPQLRWDYRVHEQIIPGLRLLGTEFRRGDVVIQHTGYLDPALRGRKRERDLRLLELERRERPADPFLLFNLGCIHQEAGRAAEALACLEESLHRSEARDSIVRKLYALIAQCRRQLGRPAEALAACDAGRLHYPNDVEILFQEALARRALGNAAGEEACWKRLLASADRPLFGSLDTGLRGYKARHNLAVLYHEQGRAREAEEQWRAAFAERPDFFPAALGLAEIYQREGRWPDLEALARGMESRPGGDAPAAVLRAHGLLVCRQFSGARQVLDAALLRHPNDLQLSVVRSHALLQEGRDLVGAEKALLRILELDPHHQEARHNLALLHQLRRLAG
jgi:glycosyltransferase involved in cell wall biosynthesis/tetratricopeptide (TPR) repeat protein